MCDSDVFSISDNSYTNDFEPSFYLLYQGVFCAIILLAKFYIIIDSTFLRNVPHTINTIIIIGKTFHYISQAQVYILSCLVYTYNRKIKIF